MKPLFIVVGLVTLIGLSGVGYWWQSKSKGMKEVHLLSFSENMSLLRLRERVKNSSLKPGLIPLEKFFKINPISDSFVSPLYREHFFQQSLFNEKRNTWNQEANDKKTAKHITSQKERDTASTGDEQELIHLEEFFQNRTSSIQLSPNGEYLAYLKPFQNRLNIHVRKVDDAKTEKRITNQTARDIRDFAWKNNDTLLFTRDFSGDENFHIFRVSLTGEGEKDLTPFKDTKSNIIDILDDISEDHILISTNQRDKRIFDVYRLNIKTGEMQLVLKNPGQFAGWVTDHKGKLRVALATDGINSSVYYRDSETEEFQEIVRTDFKDTFVPIVFTFDNKNLYAASNLDGDKIAFVEFDPK